MNPPNYPNNYSITLHCCKIPITTNKPHQIIPVLTLLYSIVAKYQSRRVTAPNYPCSYYQLYSIVVKCQSRRMNSPNYRSNYSVVFHCCKIPTRRVTPRNYTRNHCQATLRYCKIPITKTETMKLSL